MNTNMITCPVCGQQLPADSLFCSNCGSKIEIADIKQNESTGAAGNSGTMICPHCGTEIYADSVFCPGCGAPVSGMTENVTGNRFSGADQESAREKNLKVNNSKGGNSKERKPLSKKLIYTLIGIAAAVVVILILIFALGRSSGTIDLNKYLYMDYSGAEGYGTASAMFDTESFYSDYGNKVEMEFNSDTAFIWDYDAGVEELYRYCVTGTVDCGDLENGQLSNGDKVTFHWECDDDLAQSGFNVKLKYKDKTFKVEDLPEAESIDVFSGITLECTDPYSAEVSIVNNSTDGRLAGLTADDFELSETVVSNGDVVTVTITDNAVRNLINTYGLVPAETGRDYTIEGLEEYDTAEDDINEADLTNENDITEGVVAEDDSSEDTGEYLCSYSSDRLLTSADMAELNSKSYGYFPGGRSLEQMIINEIYARHGYIFKDDELKEYFGQKSWYVPTNSDMDVITSRMSQTERDNIDYLKSLE